MVLPGVMMQKGPGNRGLYRKMQGWSDELAEARDRADNGIDWFVAGLFLGKADGLLGDAGNLAHAEASAHELRAQTHHAAHQTGQEAAALDLRNRVFSAR